jgi:DNA-binding NtrC family response regulator
MIQPSNKTAPARDVVLVVDDEILIRSLIADYLRDDGLQVVEAGTADEALDFLRTANWVGLVFSDVNMPGSLDGIALAHKLREHYPGLPVLLTSGHFVLRPIDKDIKLIPKPYGLAQVTSLIREMLGRPDVAVNIYKPASGAG